MPERAAAVPVRAFWSGTITFGLVSIPVDLYAAVRKRRTSMKLVDSKGRPLGRQYYCPADNRKLDPEDIVRAYEAESGRMIVVTDEELDSVAPEMTRDIELRRFVPFAQIPVAYYQRPYFLAPSGKSAKAYHLLAQTMERTGRAGIGSFVMRGHEYLVAIISEGGVLRAETLRFAAELRKPEDVDLPRRRKAPAARVRRYARAIAKLTRDGLDMKELEDRYADEIESLVETKRRKGEDVVAPATGDDEEGGGAEIYDLMALLKRRLSPEVTVTSAAQAASSSADALEELSKAALYERAQRLNIGGRSRMDKRALVRAIRKAA